MSVIFDSNASGIGRAFSRNKVVDRARRILGPKLLYALSAAGDPDPTTLLTMIDAISGKRWTPVTDPTGITVATTGGVLNSKAYFDMPGDPDAHFHAPISIPSSYFWCLVFRVQAVSSARAMLGTPPGPPMIRLQATGRTPSYYQDDVSRAAGAGSGRVGGLVSTWSPGVANTFPALGSDCILWMSYSAADQNLYMGVNTIDAKHTATGVPPPGVWAGFDLGGWDAGSLLDAYDGPMSLWLGGEGSIVGAGSSDVDVQREQLVRMLADNFAVAIT